MRAFLDLSEICITSKGLGDSAAECPGYAYLANNSEPIVGAEAVSVAKLHPTQINNRYWAELSTEPSAYNHPKIRHNADLAWYHLNRFQPAAENKDLAVLVPSSYGTETLKLLGGIFTSLGISVSGFVNRSIAGSLTAKESNAVHVELQNHQTLLTFLENRGGVLTKTKHEKLSAFGLVRLEEHWLHIIRQRFISSYRFDPMHLGETEQQLFMQLHQLVQENHSAPYELKVTHNDQQYIEHFSDEDLAPPFLELLTEIQSKAKKQTLILDPYFLGVPGVEDAKERYLLLGNGAHFAGAELMLHGLPTNLEGMTYLDSFELNNLTEQSNDNLPTSDQSEVADIPASHLLLASHAYPAANYSLELQGQKLRLSRLQSTEPSHISYVNGQLQIGEKLDGLKVNSLPVSPGTMLKRGDVLAYGGSLEEITLISVGVEKI